MKSIKVKALISKTFHLCKSILPEQSKFKGHPNREYWECREKLKDALANVSIEIQANIDFTTKERVKLGLKYGRDIPQDIAGQLSENTIYLHALLDKINSIDPGDLFFLAEE